MSKLIFLHGPLRICLHEDSSSYVPDNSLQTIHLQRKVGVHLPIPQGQPTDWTTGGLPIQGTLLPQLCHNAKYVYQLLIKVLNVLQVASQVYRESKKISFPCTNLFTVKKKKLQNHCFYQKFFFFFIKNDKYMSWRIFKSANTRIMPAFKENHLTPSNFELAVYLGFFFF